ncbi:MAG: 30S ribosomal protein S15 [Candidatus Spechtbacteria bacterium]|nr:30S ribosomal protein S15 [Candidatus Spechtbacteria bacterium]
MLSSTTKSKIVEKFKVHEGDTGSAEVQIALLTDEIKALVKHLKTHDKDNHSRRGLLKMVSKRKKLLKYLSTEDTRRYNKVIKALGLKK